MKRILLTLTMLTLLINVNLRGETEDTVNWKGYAQMWYSYVDSYDQEGEESSAMGWSLRRCFLVPYGNLGENVTWAMVVSWSKQSPSLIDAQMNYKFIDPFQLKIGQFPAPGSPTGAVSSSTLHLVQRPLVVQKYSGNTGLYAYRAIGLQAHGFALDKKFYYAVMFANPTTNELCSPGVTSCTFSGNEGLAYWGRLEFIPITGLSFGGFFMTGEESTTDTTRNCFGAHCFYQANNILAKLEFISGKIEVGSDNETEYSGYAATFGYKIDKFEPVLRYDVYEPNGGDPDGSYVEEYASIGVGVNFYANRALKLQATYYARDEKLAEGIDDIKNNIFQINVQWFFKDKW